MRETATAAGGLDGMTQARWEALTPEERDAMRAPATPPEYAPHMGWRVEVTTASGYKERGIVSRSTGWRPCYILLSRRTSHGGGAAISNPASIRRLYKVR